MESALEYYRQYPEAYAFMKSQAEKGLVYSGNSNWDKDDHAKQMRYQREIIRLMESED